jgi:hypothetical protein
VNLSALGILLAVIVITLAIAWRQYRHAIQARRCLKQAVEELPSKVLEATRAISRLNKGDSDIRSVVSEAWCGAIDYLDVNEDGQEELLVQFPTGAHGSALKIFTWQNNKFEEFASLSVGTPVGFEYGDFDGDGNVEIRTEETDWNAGLPYVSAPRFVLLFRWNGTKFAQLPSASAATK